MAKAAITGTTAWNASRLWRRWKLASVMPSAGTAARRVKVGWHRGCESVCLPCRLRSAVGFNEWQQGMDAIAASVRHGIAEGAETNAAETMREE